MSSLIDKKLQAIGKRIYEDVYNKTVCEDWDYCSSVIYGNKLVSYGASQPYSFYYEESLDDNAYANNFAERYPERTDDAVWLEIKATLLSDLARIAKKDEVAAIIAEY